MKKHVPKVMIYCQDSLGLGHLRRNINIAHALSHLEPDTNFLLVADSPLAPFFPLPPNSDFVKLPTVVKRGDGVWEAGSLPQVPLERIWYTRAQILRDVALSFRPDIFLVDHMPQGGNKELLEPLAELRQECPHTQNILGLRDILGAPEVIMQQWKRENAYEIINDYYDWVYVYGSSEIYDLATNYRFPETITNKMRYCGYVCANPIALPKPPIKLTTQFTESKPFTVLVMGGGGHDAYHFMDILLDSIRLMGENVLFNTLMLTGPFMPAEDKNDLKDKISDLPVIVKRMKGDSIKYICAADLVISMAGYNTTCEILQYAKRAILIPRRGPSAEQSMRSQILHEQGVLSSIHPDDLSPSILGDTILTLLQASPSVSRSEAIPMSGALRAAELMLDVAVVDNEYLQEDLDVQLSRV